MNDYRCDHDPAGVCWLCSDQVPWWAEARAKAGISLSRIAVSSNGRTTDSESVSVGSIPATASRRTTVHHSWWWIDRQNRYECSRCPASKLNYSDSAPPCTGSYEQWAS